MRKLLSLLAISAIATTISTNTIACKKKPALKDIQNLQLKPITTVDNGWGLYKAIYNEIAAYAGIGVRASDIFASDMIILIGTNNPVTGDLQTIPDTSDKLSWSGEYEVKIIIIEDNLWFAKTNDAILKVQVTLPGIII